MGIDTDIERNKVICICVEHGLQSFILESSTQDQVSQVVVDCNQIEILVESNQYYMTSVEDNRHTKNTQMKYWKRFSSLGYISVFDV